MGIDRILIVDNDIKLLNSLKSGLDKFSQFKILTAFDGMQALAILKREKVSILVTGLKMRRMDGLELLAEVTREYPNIMSIVVTSSPGVCLRRSEATSGPRPCQRPRSH